MRLIVLDFLLLHGWHKSARLPMSLVPIPVKQIQTAQLQFPHERLACSKW